VDLFSTRRHGALAFVTTEYQALPLEWLLLGLAVLCAGVGLYAFLRRAKAPAPEPARGITPTGVALLLFVVHNVMLLVLWTLGNNDPLHSRYLWPSYPLLLLLAVAAYARVRSRFWLALPFRLLLALLLVVHVQRSIAATPVPVGYNVVPEDEPVER